MPGKVFISCGQSSEYERNIASTIKEFLLSQGFNPYVAIESQSIQDINLNIINELKTSDYYVFIDFAREEISTGSFNNIRRGSLFSHQELALAYYLGYEYVIFMKDINVKLEGFSKYLMSNARTFNNNSEVVSLFKEELAKSDWLPSYSRHLTITDLRIGENGKPINYTDQSGSYQEFVYHLIVTNNRIDSAAFDSVARLKEIRLNNGKPYLPADRSFLKWAGKSLSYSATILPKDFVTIDLLAIDYNNPSVVRLHSEEDYRPRRPIIDSIGDYILYYQIFAKDFPSVDFFVKVSITGSMTTTKIELI
ncbi:MAG TPA: hypothetical protein PKW76_15470 [bacterium]|nr:hypothetical protein [bacterium]HPG47075.1 hypothetical protein [bacterium]HPM99337.1 hypothetical protein [bacterium]